MLTRLLLATLRARRLWRHAPHPRRWWLVWELGNAVAEAGFRRVPAYMAGVRSLAEDPPEPTDAHRLGALQGTTMRYGQALQAGGGLRRPERQNGHIDDNGGDGGHGD